jgi:uncharacterized protein
MHSPWLLVEAAPHLARILTRESPDLESHARFDPADIRHETVWVSMRDGVRLATDIFLPPATPASAIAVRTPYGRNNVGIAGPARALAERGYVVVCQDCRGTGDSEPDVWQYCLYEAEDGIDFVDWILEQHWSDGFVFSFGGSYVAMTQWCMSAHPRMSAIAPEVGGLRTTRSTARLYMFVNGYSRVTGKGAKRLQVSHTEVERIIEAETMAGGYFNEPLSRPLPQSVLETYPDLRMLSGRETKQWLWARYCDLSTPDRVQLLQQLLNVSEFSYADYWSLPTVFDCLTLYGVHTIPARSAAELCQQFCAPALVIAGWYDWNLADVLSSWVALRREARTDVASRSRLLITPAAHHKPGYLEGQRDHPELRHNHRSNVDLLLSWYEAVRDRMTDDWPTVIYYLMGANEWRVADDWPVPEARTRALYLGSGGALSFDAPRQFSEPARYTYDPTDPTPTVGGSVLSYLYPAGSVDVSKVQQRCDVLTYTTDVLEHPFDVVGPLLLILYVSSSAADTDFVGRVSDVFPDGRALQLQSGILRARYRNPSGNAELLEPGRIYRLEIDLWATANRFMAGHRLRVDIASADFPRFDRNSNRGGEPGDPVPAHQTLYHDRDHPSHLLLSVITSVKRTA